MATRPTDKLEIHHTPKQGSWLNIAELALSVLQRQCLRQRTPNRAAMAREVTEWAERRNAAIQTIDWQFTTRDARIKLRYLNPGFDV